MIDYLLTSLLFDTLNEVPFNIFDFLHLGAELSGTLGRGLWHLAQTVVVPLLDVLTPLLLGHRRRLALVLLLFQGLLHHLLVCTHAVTNTNTIVERACCHTSWFIIVDYIFSQRWTTFVLCQVLWVFEVKADHRLWNAECLDPLLAELADLQPPIYMLFRSIEGFSANCLPNRILICTIREVSWESLSPICTRSGKWLLEI